MILATRGSVFTLSNELYRHVSIDELVTLMNKIISQFTNYLKLRHREENLEYDSEFSKKIFSEVDRADEEILSHLCRIEHYPELELYIDRSTYEKEVTPKNCVSLAHEVYQGLMCMGSVVHKAAHIEIIEGKLSMSSHDVRREPCLLFLSEVKYFPEVEYFDYGQVEEVRKHFLKLTDTESRHFYRSFAYEEFRELKNN